MFNRTKNSRIKNYFVDVLGLNPIQDHIPDSVMPSIQPVVEADKKVCNIVRGTTGTGTTATIYTTPSDQDFYLTSATLSWSKDATATAVSCNISATISNTTQVIINLAGLTLTAEQNSNTIVLDPPIKIDRNTAITLNNGTNVANIRSAGTIIGYTEVSGV